MLFKYEHFFFLKIGNLIINWVPSRGPARATFRNPEISLLIEENLEVQHKTNTKDFEFMDESGNFVQSFTVENKAGNLHKIRLFTLISNLSYNE